MVTLQTANAPALGGLIEATTDRGAFVDAVVRAAAAGRLAPEQTRAVRSLSWMSVAEAMMDVADALGAERAGLAGSAAR